MSGASPTIITKVLLPSKRPALIHRPRLVDFLHENINRKLIIVSAGAGYGKTSLLIDYAHDTELPVCWLALDEGDRDLRVLLDYVLSAIRHRFPQFGQRTQDTLQSAGFPIDIKAVVGALATDIYEEIPGYFVLILDDYHLVDESMEANIFLDTLLRHQPENCHIILASRTLPAKLTITRLVARQEVAGLGIAEMRFTADEIQELMRQNYQVELSRTQADELAQRSEGWITGILLSSHDLWGGLFKNMIRIQGDEGQVFDYLATEVFAHQSPEVQEFLIYSSVLDRMNAALCDSLLGARGADEILRSLEQRNLFIFRLEDNWYRYHHLFRSFLSAKGKAQDSGRYMALHIKAGHLFADQGLWSEAIEHYIRAAAWEEAAQAIGVAAGDAFDRGQWTTLARWIDSLPLDLLRQQPQSLFHRGKLYMDTGNSDLAMSFFDRARVEYARQGDQAGVAKTLVEEGVIYYIRGDTPKAIENSRRALAILGENSATMVVGRARRGLGTSFILQGDFNGATAELQKALMIYERLDRPYDIAITHHDLGVAHERTGNLPLSAFHYGQALRYWHRVNNPGGMANTLNSLGVIQHYQGNYHEALETLEDALQKAKEANAPRAEAYALASLGDLNRDLRNLGAALQYYEAALEIGKRKDEAFIITYALLGIGNLYCDQNKLEVARYYIEQAAENAARHHSRYETALCQLSTGILLYTQGNVKASQHSLAQAAEAFQADGAKREQARASLHLAQVALLDQQPAEVERQLGTVVELARELSSLQFAVAEGYSLSQLLKYGATHRIGDGFFREINAVLRSLSSAKPESAAKPGAPRPSAIKSLEIYAFGNSRVIRDGRIISNSEWDATITKEMFFFLLGQPQGLRKEEIIEMLWGDLSASKGNSHFHSTAYRLRKALYQECLIHENGVYRLALDVPYSYDMAEFLDLLAEAKANPKSQEECYRKAIALYRGDFLVDIYSDWVVEARERLRDEYLHALTALSAYYGQKGAYEESIALAKKALAHDNFQEAIYRQLMQYYALAGNRAAAVKCYQECSQLFKSELGTEPTLETIALYQQILSGLWDRPQA